jgi:hypothetical protein
LGAKPGLSNSGRARRARGPRYPASVRRPGQLSVRYRTDSEPAVVQSVWRSRGASRHVVWGNWPAFEIGPAADDPSANAKSDVSQRPGNRTTKRAFDALYDCHSPVRIVAPRAHRATPVMIPWPSLAPDRASKAPLCPALPTCTGSGAATDSNRDAPIDRVGEFRPDLTGVSDVQQWTRFALRSRLDIAASSAQHRDSNEQEPV